MSLLDSTVSLYLLKIIFLHYWLLLKEREVHFCEKINPIHFFYLIYNLSFCQSLKKDHHISSPEGFPNPCGKCRVRLLARGLIELGNSNTILH